MSPVQTQNKKTIKEVKNLTTTNVVIGLIGAMRPRQWVKNILLYAGVIFTGAIPGLAWFKQPNFKDISSLVEATIGFVVFCMLSSGVYLLNDVKDIEKDRQHPKKKFRPIAAGIVPCSLAITTAIVLWACALGLTAYLVLGLGLLSIKFAALSVIYLIIQIAYSSGLKNQPILDVCMISLGFILRAMAGAAAIDVSISRWLMVCTGLLSLLIGFGKRRHELVILGAEGSNHRSSLSQYSIALTDQFVTIMAAGTIVAYCMYAIESPSADTHFRLYWTIPPVLYAILRYIFLMQINEKGGAPEHDLLEDKHIMLSILIWIALSVLAFKFTANIPGTFPTGMR
ncbi:MAG: decaprenyl-phosphate phosphoribosyltransferase [bacterium]